MIEFTAYKGEKFTIEWYFDEKEKSDVLDYFNELPEDLKIKTLALFKRFADIGEIKDKTKFNFEGDSLFAFKPIPHRFLCFFVKGKKIIITNAFVKKTDKLPKNEKIRAIKRREDMKQEVKKASTTKSTFDRLMKDKSFKAKFDKEYDALNLSETLIELMESQKVSVRELSKKANVSSTVIQEIRSGKQDNPTLLVLSKLIHTLGGEIVIKKGKKTLASV